MYHCCLDLEARQQTRSLQKSLKAGNEIYILEQYIDFYFFSKGMWNFPWV